MKPSLVKRRAKKNQSLRMRPNLCKLPGSQPKREKTRTKGLLSSQPRCRLWRKRRRKLCRFALLISVRVSRLLGRAAREIFMS